VNILYSRRCPSGLGNLVSEQLRVIDYLAADLNGNASRDLPNYIVDGHGISSSVSGSTGANGRQ